MDAAAQTFDLDAYLARIGYGGARAPTLETLRAIQLRHTEAIAFENLNPLLRWPVRLDAASLQQKLVHDRRGGYCFEQNLLFGEALRAIGFRVTGLGGRVLWYTADDAVTARTHMLLRVDLDGYVHIADAGFGVQTPTGPLHLEPDAEQATPHEPYRLVRKGDGFLVQVRIGDDWRSLYRFGLEEQLLPDYEIVNWYLSSHPESRFVNTLMAARPAPGRRYTLRNNEFTVRDLNGGTERRLLGTAAEMRAVLAGPLGLTLPESADVDAVLGRLTAPAA